MLSLSFILFCFSGIVTGNETGSPSDALDTLLDIRETINSILNCALRNPVTKVLFSFIVEVLVVCRNFHKKMLFYAIPSPRVKETITGCLFSKKIFL